MYTLRLLILLICLVLLVSLVQAGIPEIEWQKTLGGSDSDEGYSIQQTSDGGYILIGNTKSSDGNVTENYGDRDVWVVKFSESGDILWQKTMGGSDSDEGYSIQQTSDGGFILIGNTKSSDGNVTRNYGSSGDVWVVKLSETGDILWQKTMGGSDSDEGYSIQQTSDNGYILTYDIGIIKLSKNGSVQWEDTIRGSRIDKGYSIQQTSDGGYILIGVTENHDGGDVWVVKLDENGEIIWQKALGGGAEDDGKSISQTSDGGYILIGTTYSSDGDVTKNHGNSDIWVVKLSDTGDIQWQKTMGGSDSEEGESIQPTSDSGYILTGWTWSSDGDVTKNHGNSDIWVIKLSDTGDIQWQKTLGGSDFDGGESIQQTSDYGYILTGYTWSLDGDVTENHGGKDVWIIKLTENKANY